jgi:hypothetical protein
MQSPAVQILSSILRPEREKKKNQRERALVEKEKIYIYI